MKDDKKIKTEKIVLNGLVIAGIVLTLLAVLSSPLIIVAIIKAGEFSALPPYTWILTTASVYVCAVPYMAALIELKLICSRIFTDKAFSLGTAKKFRNIGICAFVELLVFAVDQAVLCSMLGIYELMGLYYLPVFVFAFVCVVAGYSLGMFALFYWLIDVKGYKGWVLPFQVIGLNSITIYMAQRIVDFKGISAFFFGGLAAKMPEAAAPIVASTGYLLVCWLFLYFLYKKRIFLKV